MNAEIIGVGTELLLGQIANTNAQYLSRALAGIGIDVFFHTAVGDNLERVTHTIETGLERSDAVLITGGLGPTPDDLTRDAVAAALGRSLVREERLARRIREFFASVGREMPEENLKQADLPEGAIPIEPEGTAPGFYVDAGDRLIVALPGVPWEMRVMMDETVRPLLERRAGGAAIVSREIFVIGLGESHTHEKIADIVDAQTNPTIAFLSGKGQVRVRITAKAPTDEDARALIEPVEDKIRDRLGEAAVPGSHESLADALGAMLRERAATVAVAESLTGGLIAAELTRAAGASDFFIGSLVCYTTQAKRDVAGVEEGILGESGPVSEDAAGALAAAAAAWFSADLGLAATGVAGPAEHGGRPAGTVYVAATFRGRTEVRRVRGYGDRQNVRALAVTSALDLGRRLLSRS